MQVYRLENRTGHFKFYELWAGAYVNIETGIADKAFVGTRWGRIGTEGQTKLIEFEGYDCKVQAYDLVHKKIQEKLSRGYEIVKTPETISELPNTVDLIKEQAGIFAPAEETKQEQLTFQMG